MFNMRNFATTIVALFMWTSIVQAINYPTTVDGVGAFGTAVHGAPVLHTTINSLRDAVIALETKVGANGSLNTATLDYLLTNSASVNPGHTHTGSSLSNLDASTITLGTLSDSRLSANVALKNAANTWALLQTFSSGISVTGTATATTFSGSGASLTNIPETAITNGTLLARVADNESISGSWTFFSPPTADGSNITNILEANISDGTLLARVADNETISGLWSFSANVSFVANIAKIRNQPLVWPALNASGALTNDGSGNLSWTASAAPPTPGGGTGAVQFNTGGTFNGDAAKFFWDNASKRLGIGTSTPTTELDVSTGTITSGTHIATTDNTYDIGNSSTGSFRTGYFDTSVVSPLFTFGGALSITTTASNGNITLDANGSGTIVASDEFRPSGDNTIDLGDVSFSWRTVYADTSVLTPLLSFGGALSITTTASNGNITLDANGAGNIIASDLFRPSGDNTIDLGSSAFSWRTVYADTSVLTPLVSFAGAVSITTTAGNADITLDPNGSGSVVYSTDVDYSNTAVCYVNSSGKLGHCTTSNAANCACTAN